MPMLIPSLFFLLRVLPPPDPSLGRTGGRGINVLLDVFFWGGDFVWGSTGHGRHPNFSGMKFHVDWIQNHGWDPRRARVMSIVV